MKGNILIIGDTHEPFAHPKYLSFCCRQRDKYKPTHVVHIGDEVDNHAISYHETDPDGYSASREADLAEKHLHKWFKEFPNVKVCIGNHSHLHLRQGKSAGLPKRFIKTDFNDVWNIPKTWKWDFGWDIYGVHFQHGTKNSGKYAHLRVAETNRQSTVIGHTHAFGGCGYLASHRDLIFGLNAGCGVSIKDYAFVYGKDFKYRPTLGCGVIEDYGHKASFIPMKL